MEELLNNQDQLIERAVAYNPKRDQLKDKIRIMLGRFRHSGEKFAVLTQTQEDLRSGRGQGVKYDPEEKEALGYLDRMVEVDFAPIEELKVDGLFEASTRTKTGESKMAGVTVYGTKYKDLYRGHIYVSESVYGRRTTDTHYETLFSVPEDQMKELRETPRESSEKASQPLANFLADQLRSIGFNDQEVNTFYRNSQAENEPTAPS